MAKRDPNTIEESHPKKLKADLYASAPETPPDKATVLRSKTKWKAYAEQIMEYIKEDDERIEREALATEIRKYKHEGRQKREDRYRKKDEWEWEDDSGCDVKCREDDCWYKGNMDRINEYAGVYRLRGTTDVFLCDVCFDNGPGDPSRDNKHYLYDDLSDGDDRDEEEEEKEEEEDE